jgi:FMN phosphatase YigB (HAD superfamily)
VRPIVIGKPHRPLFDFTIARLGCAPREAAMVGDNLASDMTGGHAAGMFTIWIDAHSHHDLPQEADLKVKSLVELLQLWRDSRSSKSNSRY